jgi:hypothetical protein
MEVRGQFHIPDTLLHGERTPNADRIECWVDAKLLWTVRRKENFLPPLGIKLWFPDCPVGSLVTTPTELLRYTNEQTTKQVKQLRQP